MISTCFSWHWYKDDKQFACLLNNWDGWSTLFYAHYLNRGRAISMTTHCISVQISSSSELMGYYYMTDDVESFYLPWADLSWYSNPPSTTTTSRFHPCGHRHHEELSVCMDWIQSSWICYQGAIRFPWLTIHHCIKESNLIILKQDHNGSIKGHMTNSSSSSPKKLTGKNL